jgi:hypothetical protein
MKRICLQAASSGCCWRVVDWACSKRPRPAQSSPSIGVSGQPAVNQAGAATVAPPRVRRDAAVPEAAHAIVFLAHPVVLQRQAGRYTCASSSAGASAARAWPGRAASASRAKQALRSMMLLKI